jgi:hypothetical protein
MNQENTDDVGPVGGDQGMKVLDKSVRTHQLSHLPDGILDSSGRSPTGAERNSLDIDSGHGPVSVPNAKKRSFAPTQNRHESFEIFNRNGYDEDWGDC